MPTKAKDLTGMRFGRWTVTARGPLGSSGRSALWSCRCDCGKEKLLQSKDLRRGHTTSCGCYRDSLKGPRSHSWKGGRYHSGGYAYVKSPHHPNAIGNGYVAEHILVMSEALGRPLVDDETVHHRNGIKDDNRKENLELRISHHGPGQRAEDMVEFAVEILRRYAPERLV